MKYLPRHDFVLIRFDKIVVLPKEGFRLAEGLNEPPHTGTVLAVGPGKETPHGHVIVPLVKEGDYVRANRYTAIEIDKKERLYFVEYSNIQCIIER